MITLEQAHIIAKKFLEEAEKSAKLPLAIMKDLTIEFEYGWVFFYNTKRYVEDNDESVLLGGNAPVIIDKLTGKISQTGTAHDVEVYIDRYIKTQKA